LWIFNIKDKTYELVTTNGQNKPAWNGVRGSHTAVMIKDTMYVFGGSKDGRY